MMTEICPGNIYIVAAPSGGGKTSLVKNLIGTLDNIVVSISHTTRGRRPQETQGLDYFFVEDAQFLNMVKEGAFVEHAEVFGHYYGTSTAQLEERIAQGIDVVLDIDWQGAQQIKQLFPSSVNIFIIPPSLQVLEQRLASRGRDEASTIAERMLKAQEEMRHYVEFDYLIVNDDFEHAAQALQSIVLANRLEVHKQAVRQAKLLSFLLSS
jgi:guanylate kinase